MSKSKSKSADDNYAVIMPSLSRRDAATFTSAAPFITDDGNAGLRLTRDDGQITEVMIYLIHTEATEDGTVPAPGVAIVAGNTAMTATESGRGFRLCWPAMDKPEPEPEPTKDKDKDPEYEFAVGDTVRVRDKVNYRSGHIGVIEGISTLSTAGNAHGYRYRVQFPGSTTIIPFHQRELEPYESESVAIGPTANDEAVVLDGVS